MGGEAFDLFGRKPLAGQHGARLLEAAPEHQRPGLRQHVCEQKAVLGREILFMPLRRGHEFARHDIGALVDHLEEGMLAIGAGLAPHNGPRGQIEGIARKRHPLAVALHLELLEIGRQARQPLIVGQHGAGGIAHHLPVPDPGQRQRHGHAFFQRRGAEMLVHRVAAGEEIGEIAGPDRQHQRKPDRPPDRIAPPHPVGKIEHPRRIDTEFARAARMRRNGDELAPRILHRPRHPLMRHARIGEGFHGGEAFRGHDHQRAGGIEAGERIGDVGRIEIGHEMAARAVVIRGKRAGGHGGAEIGAADADIDDIGDRRRPLAAVFARAKRAREGLHAPAGFEDLIGDVDPAEPEGGPIGEPQRPVDHGAVLGFVDGRAGKHAIAPRRHGRGAGQIEQQRAIALADRGFREIEQHRERLDGETFISQRLGGEEIGDTPRGGALSGRKQPLPCRIPVHGAQ